MKCANCLKRIRRAQRFYKIYFFFQSVAHKPRRRSPASFVSVCWDCVEKLQKGKNPKSSLAHQFAFALATLCRDGAKPAIGELSRDSAPVLEGQNHA